MRWPLSVWLVRTPSPATLQTAFRHTSAFLNSGFGRTRTFLSCAARRTNTAVSVARARHNLIHDATCHSMTRAKRVLILPVSGDQFAAPAQAHDHAGVFFKTRRPEE